MIKPISDRTWNQLVEINRGLSALGKSPEGVFAPAVGPKYIPGADTSLLYIGKSAGPLGTKVGSNYDQSSSITSSTNWMITKRNNSAFWKFAELFDPSRKAIAWTNVCKMDEGDGGRPPTRRFWDAVADIHVQALAEEIDRLQPRLALFVVAGFGHGAIETALQDTGYRNVPSPIGAETRMWENDHGRYALATRHPQGWSREERAPAVSFAKKLLGLH